MKSLKPNFNFLSRHYSVSIETSGRPLKSSFFFCSHVWHHTPPLDNLLFHKWMLSAAGSVQAPMEGGKKKNPGSLTSSLVVPSLFCW